MALPEPYYQDDAGITVYHGDCREILPLLPDRSVDLVLSDPPYGANNNNGDLRGKSRDGVGFANLVGSQMSEIANDGQPESDALYRVLLEQSRRLLAPGAACCVCCGGGGPEPRFAEWTLLMREVLGFKMCVIWDKIRPGIGWHYRRTWECILVSETSKWNGGLTTQNIIHMNGLSYGKEHHPTQKPIELMKLFVGLHSNPGELVVDPFAGSLTTLVAAKQMGRRAIGVELDSKWIDLGVKSLQQAQLLTDEYKPAEQVELLP